MNTSTLYSWIEPVVRKHIGLGAKNHKPQFSQIFDVSSTDEPIREFQENAGPTLPSLKTEEAAVANRIITAGAQKRVQAATYASGMTFSREVLDDIKDSQNAAQLRKVTTASGAMGRSFKLLPEYLTAQFFARAFTAGYPVTVDNVNLVSASHVSPLGTTYSNILATPAAFSESALEDVMTQLRTTTAADGLLVPVMGETVIVPSAYHMYAKKLSMSERTLGSANNDPNVVRSGTKFMTFDYLVSQTQWFVKTDADNGLYWDWRTEPEYERDNIANTQQVQFIGFMRAMWGAEDPRCIIGVNAA